MEDEIRVLAPQGLLGYGFPVKSFQEALRRNPHVIAVDGGSTDPGPYYLGAGVSFTDQLAVKRDLEFMLEAALDKGIPLIIGTAGGAGGKPHLDWNVDIVKEIAKERDYSFLMAVISAEINKDVIFNKLKDGKIRTFETRKELKAEDVSRSTRIVAQMGVEPFLKALDAGAQVIVAGRAYDPACQAAVPLKHGFDYGLVMHMCKILECGAIACVPGTASDCLLGTMRKDHFIVEPTNSDRRCTEVSVAAHTLYEKGNPEFLPGPGGAIDLRQVKFEQMGDRAVKVSGSRFIKDDVYAIKLEGAARVGFRTISIAGARCPKMISQIDSIITGVKERVQENFITVPTTDYQTIFHIYGKNGVMGDLEPEKTIRSHELGIVIEVVAKTQELANAICSVARSVMLHFGYPGRIATAGNLAFLYSPSDLKAGEVYEFSVYHLMEVTDPCEMFPMELIKVGGSLS
ncbi:MAG: acyclic terpene utilization AtuA family protein [Syntrophobacteraceae bacterium]